LAPKTESILMQKCAILTMDNLDDFEAYDDLLEAPLKQLDWEMIMVSWRDESVNWNDYDAVIIRSPWDYQDEPAAFMQVLEKINASTAHLENSLDIVRWNIDKEYLKSLEKNGVTIVPTLWRDVFNVQELASYFEHFGSEQIVLKPRISANADNTFWLTKDNFMDHVDALALAFTTRPFMVQPFMASVINEGEFSLFYFDGQYSHTILKTPKDNDFRVQEEHGGRLQSVTPEEKLVQQATHALSAIDEMPLYARVDFVRHGEQFALMESELIEPSLYFNMDDKSASRFAKAFANKMKSLT
jgi:glutathione synthase/RimK-type ligase-like ATP-grasp enzyme